MFRIVLWMLCLMGSLLLAQTVQANSTPPHTPELRSTSRSKNVYSPLQFYQVTREPALLAALRLLPGTAGESSLQWILQMPAHAVFKDMATLGEGVKAFDALSWIGPKGEHMIFINSYHQNAPPEALAALLAHEGMHRDGSNSLAEETAAWTMEATVWQQLRPTSRPSAMAAPVKKLKRNQPQSLLWRLEQLSAALNANRMEALVQQNPDYHGLSESSPGFQKN
ncbi:MAG: hypothetical protein VKK59_05475 [Vampirovibrionales bacterium]|nr:hypothetical protein [Vampirovibrionales bacterium]